MKCSFCGGRVEWQGPFANLTHTKCLGCGRFNCQEADQSDEDPNEKSESRAGIPPFESGEERRPVDVIL
jgi:hypothetical protein